MRPLRSITPILLSISLAMSIAVVTIQPSPASAVVPTCALFSPTDGASSVSISANLTITCTRVVERGTGTLVIKRNNGTPIETFDIATSTKITGWGTSTITVDPENLNSGTGYFINYSATAFKDVGTADTAAGISDSRTWNFTTTGTVATPWSTGSGTSASPWEITNCAQLLSIDHHSSYWNDFFILTNNIDCTGTTVYPMLVGTSTSDGFAGSINGNLKTVSNVNVSCTTQAAVDLAGCGIFKLVSGGATFRDMTLSSVTINETVSTDGNVGALFGWQSTGTTASTAITISGITLNGLAITSSAGTYVGGLAGRCGTCILTNVSTAGTITGKSLVGGVLGQHGGDSQTSAATMSNVSSSAVITATLGSTSSRQYVGGIVGKYSMSSSAVTANRTLSDVTFTGSITADSTSIGGIAGDFRYGIVSDASSSGNITGHWDVGGLFGESNSSTVTTSQSSGTISGTSASSCTVGGISGSFTYSTLTQSFSTATVKGFCGLGGLLGGAFPTSTSTRFIENSYFAGALQQTGTGSFARSSMGGLVGSMSSGGTIATSYAVASSATYTAPPGSDFQGLVGGLSHGKTATCSSVFWDKDVSAITADKCTSGASKTTSLMKTQSTFSDFDFTNIWSISGSVNNGYPVLRAFTSDTTAPTATWTAPSTPSSSRTLSYTLAFSESVSSIAASDFNNDAGTATGCVFTPSATSGTSITVSVTCASDGTVVARLAANAVSDSAGNTGPASNADASSVTIDTSAPTATWTAPSTPSSSRTLNYTLAFSESVNSIAAGDFNNDAGTATGCVFTPSATSGTSITVSATCSSDGTVVARLAANAVSDSAGNTGPASNADASSVTIDTSAPTTTAVTTTTAAPAPTTTAVTTTTAAPAPTTTVGTTTTTSTTTSTTVPDGVVGINSWTIEASSSPAAPGSRIVLTTTISCGRQMSTNSPPYYPSMYYLVNSPQRINGVYGRPTLSNDRRTATFTVTVTAPSKVGTYQMYAYGRDNPFGRTCTGDSFNFAASSVFTLAVGESLETTTTSTLSPEASTTSTSIALLAMPAITTTTSPATTTTEVAASSTTSSNPPPTSNPAPVVQLDVTTDLVLPENTTDFVLSRDSLLAIAENLQITNGVIRIKTSDGVWRSQNIQDLSDFVMLLGNNSSSIEIEVLEEGSSTPVAYSVPISSKSGSALWPTQVLIFAAGLGTLWFFIFAIKRRRKSEPEQQTA